MAKGLTTDFRFRVSKAVGSPSVQGAATMETLANHTENPHPHPQYMRKSYVGMEMGLTEHLANRLHHARNYALRDELTTSKLDYERYKLQSLAHDASNYMTQSGVKAHVITSYVLNQILTDVGLDGSVKALTYNNLVNSYDTKVTDASKYAPTWEIFLKLKNSISDWLINGKPSDYVLKEDWRQWILYMYGEVDPNNDTHPLRPGLKVALYATEYNYETFSRPNVDNDDAINYARLTDLTFIPDIERDQFQDAMYFYKATEDTTPSALKEYARISNGQLVPFTGDSFATGTTYYEKVYQDLNKIQGTSLTCGCDILEVNCKKEDPAYFDWSNGEKWEYYAGVLGNPSECPYSARLMVWEGRIRLVQGQTIKFAGVVDDFVMVRIDNTILTRKNSTNYWQNLGDYQDAEEYGDCTEYSYTAGSSGLHDFKLAIFNKQTVGPRSGLVPGNTSWTVPFRMSLDGGTTWVPISNTSLSNPIFFLPEGSEKDIRNTNDKRDRYNYKPDRKPGLLIKLWESPGVTSSEPISGTSYPFMSDHLANMRLLHWSTGSFFGDEIAATSTDRIWQTAQGPVITNGCSMLAKSSTHDDQYFFDWFNAQSWKCWSGNADESVTDIWTKRLIGWFGSIYLRKGESVKFHGRVDDFWFIKIDDTWVIDHELYLDYPEGESPVHEFVATYTGYHPFKLLAININTVGPRPSGSNDYPKMSFNGTTWVDISNESFDTPRFFLPDDCDHEKYWSEGIISRAKYSSAGIIVPMSSASSKRLSHSLNDLAKNYGSFTINSRKYRVWRFIVGKTYNSNTDEFVDDPNWKPGCDVGYVSIDVGFRDTVWATFDNYMFLWTPDDTSPCQAPDNSSAVESRYYGVRMCVQHSIPDTVDWNAGRSVHQQTLVVPKGSIITFVVGGSAHDDSATIACCHSTITYFWNPKL